MSDDILDEVMGGAADEIKTSNAFDKLPGGEGGWLHQIILYAAKNPWDFCWYVLLLLSPMFCISAFLSWKLAQEIQAQEKNKEKKSKRQANISKVKKRN